MPLVIQADFTNTSEGGVTRIPAGEYVWRVAGVKQKKSNKEGAFPYLEWKLIGVNGNAKNVTLYEITSLKPEALFNLYNFLVAAGFEVPKRKAKLDMEKVVGKYVGAAVDDEEYQAKDGTTKKKSSIVSFFAVKKTPDGKWGRTGEIDEDAEPEDDIPEEELNELDDAPEEPELEEEEEEAPPPPPPPAKKITKKETPKPATKKETKAPKKEEKVEDDIDLDAELAALEAELD